MTQTCRTSLAALAVVGAGLFLDGLLRADVIIDPDVGTATATSYYFVEGLSPQRMVDNSGLAQPLNNGDPIPAVWPTHTNVRADMYWSGAENTPTLTFTLHGFHDISSLHYWNYNDPGCGPHCNNGPERGFRGVDILVATDSVLGPYTLVGSYEFAEAPGTPDYTGATLALGQTVRARFVQLHVTSDWTGEAAGSAEIRFMGNPFRIPGDLNCDGVVNFEDINPFVLALIGQAAYEATFPDCDWHNADANGDGQVNFGDINPFVALLAL